MSDSHIAMPGGVTACSTDDLTRRHFGDFGQFKETRPWPSIPAATLALCSSPLNCLMEDRTYSSSRILSLPRILASRPTRPSQNRASLFVPPSEIQKLTPSLQTP
jgi:hypothetical protein